MATDDHDIENTITGEVDGEVIQVGNGGDSSTSKVRNIIMGKVTGPVIQAGDIAGPLTF
jgi:hypothetical protein